jgi:hypothetical protein
MPCLRRLAFHVPNLSTIATVVVILGGSTCMAHADDAGKPASASVRPERLTEIKGQYQLADGRLLTITDSGRTMRAQLDGRPDTVLLPAGGTAFMARDGSFRLNFEQLENGSVNAVTLDEMPAGSVEARPERMRRAP